MIHNPFKYFPKIADELKKADKNSRKYKKLLRRTTERNSIFVARLTECLIEDTERSGVYYLRNSFVYESKNVFMFICIGIIAIILSALFRLGVFGEAAVDYSVYALIAALGTFPFIGFYGHKTHVTIRKLAEIYLEDFCVTDEKFTPEYMQRLADITNSDNDIILQDELETQIPCGCYTCKHVYTSDRLVVSERTHKYICPHCGKTTIVSERCGEHITQELIDDLYEYWKE